MTKLAEEIEQALDGRRISEVAEEWDVPRWVLDDLRHNRLKTPGAPYLIAIARGLGKTVEELMEPQPA